MSRTRGYVGFPTGHLKITRFQMLRKWHAPCKFTSDLFVSGVRGTEP